MIYKSASLDIPQNPGWAKAGGQEKYANLGKALASGMPGFSLQAETSYLTFRANRLPSISYIKNLSNKPNPQLGPQGS